MSLNGTEIVVRRSNGSSAWLDVISSFTGDTLREIIPATATDIQIAKWAIDGSTILYASPAENPNSPYYNLNIISSFGDSLNRLTGQSIASSGCNFGILPVGDVNADADYGLVLGAQVTKLHLRLHLPQ